MTPQIIPEYRSFDGKRYRRAGAWKSKSDATKRAISMRGAGWSVRTVKFSHKLGIRYVNYRK